MIELGPEQCRKIDEALAREWLVTNGLGGYASTTIIGTPTRRYHGLLVAAAQSPGHRLALLSQCEEMLTYDGRPHLISTTEYEDGTLAPAGYIHLLRFRLERGLPLTVYEIGDTTLEKSVWMAWGQNTTYVRYRLSATARGPAELRLHPLLSGRPFHQLVRGAPERMPPVSVEDRWCCLDLPGTTVRLRLRLTGDHFEPRADWYWRVLYRRERERGLDYSEDLFAPGTLVTVLQPGEAATLIISTEPVAAIVTDSDAAWQAEWQRRGQLLQRAGVAADDALGQTLVLAADAFLVATPRLTSASAAAVVDTVIAGYPWFGEQSRESVIAVPGLLLATGRADEARTVLAALIDRQRGGLLPSRWHEESGWSEPAPSESGLWLAVTLRHYLEETGDHGLLAASWPALVEIAAAYGDGPERGGPVVDPDDGLLRLTDASGRRRKPVDLNALWYNLLRQMAAWATSHAPERVAAYMLAAERVQTSLNRHAWYAPRGYLADLGDGETIQDLALRAGQLLAIGLPYPVLTPERWRPVLDTVTDHLLTLYGPRTLSPSDPAYIGWYAGDAVHREQAQQRGTIWPWLLALYDAAYRRVYGSDGPLREQLGAFRRHLRVAGLGFVSEFFDGDAPHSPQGAIAQASSVAVVLQLWRAVNRAAG